MSDYLRKGFLLGLGAAVSGKEKLEEMLKVLVERNELTQEQAKNMMQNFIEKGDKKKEEWNEKQQEQMLKTAKELGLATHKDLDELRTRVQALEAKLQEENTEE